MSPEIKGFIVVSVAKLLVTFLFLMVVVAYTTLIERWVCAWMQDRLGPNRAGWKGILQPVADGIKNITKEEMMPGMANKALFLLAPALALFPAFVIPMIIPWGAPFEVNFDFTLPLLGRFVHSGLASTAVADVPVGFLFILAFSSLGVYGIALAGWASNSKYSLLGGLRATAQMISYELAMGLSLVPLLLVSGNVSLTTIVQEQQAGPFGWYLLPLTISAFVFFVSGLAELNRVPFDMPEAESELVAGYHAEYSSMKFSAFFIAEYSNMFTMSMLFTTLFLGGWGIPFTKWDETPGLAQTLVTGGLFFFKSMFIVFVFIWLRWTLPRFRYDQLMALGWKVLLPVALAYLVITSLGIWGIEQGLGITTPWQRNLALFVVNLPLLFILFRVLDGGTIIRGSSVRARSSASRLGRAA
ncbi:MAG TPA: NADH-quinone oxidoreductase subunit NuoH [Gemmatimonadales bacterium]|nr:NADH-quinone oxidoreductase subunit NuoH [Gemmatimonadales bacterium]